MLDSELVSGAVCRLDTRNIYEYCCRLFSSEGFWLRRKYVWRTTVKVSASDLCKPSCKSGLHMFAGRKHVSKYLCVLDSKLVSGPVCRLDKNIHEYYCRIFSNEERSFSSANISDQQLRNLRVWSVNLAADLSYTQSRGKYMSWSICAHWIQNLCLFTIKCQIQEFPYNVDCCA